MIAHRRLRRNPFILPLAIGVLGVIGLLLANGGTIPKGMGFHNVHYNVGDGDGLHPCNDNGNNFWLNMWIEWAEGKTMHTGWVDCTGVMPSTEMDKLVSAEMKVRKIDEAKASWELHQEVLHFVIKRWAAGLIR